MTQTLEDTTLLTLTEDEFDETTLLAAKPVASVPPAAPPSLSVPPEVQRAIDLARRYRLPYTDLLPPDRPSPIDYELLSKLPVDLMLRHQFVPLNREGSRLHIAMADPADLERLDDITAAARAALGIRIVMPHVANRRAIETVLKKRRRDAARASGSRERFPHLACKETESGEEVLDLDRLATDAEMSPIIKLVDTIVFNALESRASDIHIETRDTNVQVKFRIDGALYQKVDPIDLAFHQTLISRIKVMSELDIAERRTPQDGRFRVRYKGRNVDFRVSIMPTVHGEDAVIRILDKEQINEEFKTSALMSSALPKTTCESFAATSPSLTAWSGHGSDRFG
jgi:type IV pilus assembly protein PilB